MGTHWSRSCNECLQNSGNACTNSCFHCLNNVGRACHKYCMRDDRHSYTDPDETTLLIINRDVPMYVLNDDEKRMRRVAKLNSILNQSLWSDLAPDDQPLFRLDTAQFWGCIAFWIQNDVLYKKVLNEMKRVCRKNRISGSVLSFFYREKKGDHALIENAIKTEMARCLTTKTMDIIFDELKRWIHTVDLQQLQQVTTDEMGQFLIETPIGNLKNEIIENQIDGRRFVMDPAKFGKTVHTVTGWTKSECDLLRKTMERKISLTADQFLERVESRAAEKGFAPTVIAKLRNRLESECDLEDVHYAFRTKGTVQREFSESVVNLLSDLMAEQKENEIDDENQFVVDYFDILSSVSLTVKVDCDGNEVNGPYICPCCGNLNVIKIVGYRYTDNLSVCSLCGVSAKEAVAMALKRVPLPYQSTLNDGKPDEITLYNPTMFIHSEPLRWAQNKRMDLHCAVQRDSNLSPVLQHLALILVEQTRFRRRIDGKTKDTKLREEDLVQFVTLKVYKETFLGAVQDILSAKEPLIKDDAVQSLQALLEDEKHPLYDFANYFGGKGLRKEFLNILKEMTGMKPGTAGAIFKSVLGQLRKLVFTELYRQWLQAIDVENIKNDRENIDKYHLNDASPPKREAILSFFREAIGEEDNGKKTERFLNHPVDDELNQFRLELLNYDDTKDVEDDEQKSIEVTAAADGAEQQSPNPWKFITETEDINEFAFGVEMNYISLKPQSKSIREELHAMGFGNVFFNILAKAIKKYLKIRKNNGIFQVSREYAPKHGIVRNQFISMIHLVAVLLYTDCTELSCIFMSIRSDLT